MADNFDTLVTVGMALTAVLLAVVYVRKMHDWHLDVPSPRSLLLALIPFDVYCLVWGSIIVTVILGFSWVYLGWLAVCILAITLVTWLGSLWQLSLFKSLMRSGLRSLQNNRDLVAKLRGDERLAARMKRWPLLRPTIEAILNDAETGGKVGHGQQD